MAASKKQSPEGRGAEHAAKLAAPEEGNAELVARSAKLPFHEIKLRGLIF